MRLRPLYLVAGAALAAALVTAPASAAQGPPTTGGETTLGNNLSVPAIFVPGTAGAPALRVACGQHQAPGWDGVAASATYPGYWLQKSEATWSADCATAPSAAVVADWGDNLTVSPSLAAGRPIRVEVGLLAPDAVGLTGYTVSKLTTDLADRLATYGTRGIGGDAFATGDAGAPYARVWDAQTSLTIERVVDGVVTGTVYSGPATAEINSTGAVVYGYNWGAQGRANAPVAGTYRLTFTTSAATTITGVADLTGNVPAYAEHSTSLEITLTAGSGGGGGGGGGGH